MRDASVAVSANLCEYIYLRSIIINDYISVSYRRFMSTNRILANVIYSRLFSDVSVHRIHDGGVDLLHAMDRERR